MERGTLHANKRRNPFFLLIHIKESTKAFTLSQRNVIFPTTLKEDNREKKNHRRGQTLLLISTVRILLQ